MDRRDIVNTAYLSSPLNQTHYRVDIQNVDAAHAGNWMEVILNLCQECRTSIIDGLAGNWTRLFQSTVDVDGAFPTGGSQVTVYQLYDDPADARTEQCLRNVLEPGPTQDTITEGALIAFIIIGAVILIGCALVGRVILRSSGGLRGLMGDLPQLTFLGRPQPIGTSGSTGEDEVELLTRKSPSDHQMSG